MRDEIDYRFRPGFLMYIRNCDLSVEIINVFPKGVCCVMLWQNCRQLVA